jgi:hypothetical protein
MTEGAEARSRFYDVGFDVERTIRALYEWLKDRSYTKIEQDPSKPLWEFTWAAAEHHEAHRMGGCSAAPCPALGVSRALYVCSIYLRERDAYFAWIHGANRIAAVMKQLREGVQEVSDAAQEIRRASEKLHEQELLAKVDRPTHRHDLMCERPTQLAQVGEAWVGMLGATAIELLQKSTDPGLAQEPGKERRTRLLRNTVWQHLAWDGGLDLGQIVKLAPGTETNDHDRQKDLVRKAVAKTQDDLRWTFELALEGKEVVPSSNSAESTDT